MVIIPTFQAEEKELEEKKQNNLIVSKETFASLIRKKIFPELFSHEEKRKKVRLIVTGVCLVVFVILFAFIQK